MLFLKWFKELRKKWYYIFLPKIYKEYKCFINMLKQYNQTENFIKWKHNYTKLNRGIYLLIMENYCNHKWFDCSLLNELFVKTNKKVF